MSAFKKPLSGWLKVLLHICIALVSIALQLSIFYFLELI